jgi:hypothetical protein
MAPETVRQILALHFSDEEKARYEVLAEKAQEGTLTPDEELEIDSFLQVNNLLAILKAKVRQLPGRQIPAA